MMNTSKQPGVQFSQIFLSEAHFRHRADVLSLPPDTKVGPQPLAVDVRILSSESGPAVALIVRVATKDDEPEPLYSFVAEMTAIIEQIPGQENLPPADFARVQGVAALYPFVREAVANLTSRGRFGPVYLLPFNLKAALEPGQQPEASTPSDRRPSKPKRKSRAHRAT